MTTADEASAREGIRAARELRRPLLLRELYKKQLRDFTIDCLQDLPNNVKVRAELEPSGSREARLSHARAFDQFGCFVIHQLYRNLTSTSLPAVWVRAGVPRRPPPRRSAHEAVVHSPQARQPGHLRDQEPQHVRLHRHHHVGQGRPAAAVPEVSPPTPHPRPAVEPLADRGLRRGSLGRFLAKDLAPFRERSGYKSLRRLGDAVFESAPQSQNVLVTGPDDSGRPLKSEAHQDEYDNLMLVATGAKIWALAELTDEQVARASGGRSLKRSLGLDAVETARNRRFDDMRVANCFTRVIMTPGDVLYNPGYVWHQVNSDPNTLAYSVMYPLPGAASDDEQDQPEGAEGRERHHDRLGLEQEAEGGDGTEEEEEDEEEEEKEPARKRVKVCQSPRTSKEAGSTKSRPQKRSPKSGRRKHA
jgi:hypothetical protein